MAHCITEMREMAQTKDLAEKELEVQHQEFVIELEELHGKLEERGEELMQLKKDVAEKEEILLGKEHDLERAREDIRVLRAKTDYDLARKEEDTFQISDQVREDKPDQILIDTSLEKKYFTNMFCFTVIDH